MRSLSDKLFICSVFLLISSVVHAQQLYYVVIGGFAVEANAEKFSGYVRTLRYDAAYDFHSDRKLSYVYILKTAVREDAYAQVRQLQSESEFKDAWVFNGLLDRDKNPAPVAVLTPPVETIVTDTTTETVPDTVQVTDVEVKPDSASLITTPVSTTSLPSFDPAKVVKGKLFRFVIQTQDGKIIPGNVYQVDFSRGRDVATYASGEYLDVLPPSRDHNPMTIVCAIFGYKEVVKTIDYNLPGGTAGVMPDENKAWVIPYQLEPMTAGDISVMYHVSFYKDAVIMLPPARAELDQLVNMMTINPNYKIKIHGHCNGNNARRIIAIGSTRNYFEMKGSDERKGSAKELSRLRAEAVQAYLMEHGIDKERTELYAWGGLNMLVSETSTSAKLNDRIEIEILKN